MEKQNSKKMGLINGIVLLVITLGPVSGKRHSIQRGYGQYRSARYWDPNFDF